MAFRYNATGALVVTGLDAGSSEATSHAALTGLGANDHPQYLLRDGTNAMTGQLDAIAGNAAAPGVSVVGDDTGLFSPGAGAFGLAAAGAMSVTGNASGFGVNATPAVGERFVVDTTFGVSALAVNDANSVVTVATGLVATSGAVAVAAGWHLGSAFASAAYTPSNGGDGVINVLNDFVVNLDSLNGSTARSFRVAHNGTGTAEALLFEVLENGNGLIGTVADSGSRYQIAGAAAAPVLDLTQNDIDDTFINYIGTSAADGSRSISSDVTEDAAKFGAFRVEINGVTKWVRVYDDES